LLGDKKKKDAVISPNGEAVSEKLKHIAFIMDGNGRWAQKRLMPREAGHKTGAKVFDRIACHCFEIGIPTVTVYAFSTENWSRPQKEVDAINAELRRLPFGSDTYSFMMDDREDRSEFFRICRKLNDFGTVDMLQSMNGADEELAHDIKSFMDKILAEQDESEFTDYRKYFKYDMRIRTKRGGNEVESDLSKKQGSASNGEKQTPYFIILAASLMQCYPRNTECARLAFIDEAFAALSRAFFISKLSL